MNVPKLRFKEFTGEWNRIDLSKTFSYYSTNSLSRDLLSDNGIIKSIHYGDIHKKYKSLVDCNLDVTTYIKDSNYNNKYEKCKENDLIIADASEDYDGIGKSIEIINLDDDFVISGLHTILARDINRMFSPKFKGYYFNSPVIHNQIRVLANGFKVFGISKNTINSLITNLPSKDEQTKIANMLQLLDKKIELQSKKIEALKLYKKGLNIEIFKMNIFKKIKYKEIFNSIGGTSLETFVNSTGEYKFISIGNYSKDGIYLDTKQRIDLNDKTKEKLLNKGDLVMILNDKTASGDIIGCTILIDESNKYIYNQRSQRLICNNKVNSKYAWCFLNSVSNRKNIFNHSQGGTQIYINFSIVEKLDFLLPIDESYQLKISNILITLNKKIELELQKTNQLIELKKGLMQSMFI